VRFIAHVDDAVDSGARAHQCPNVESIDTFRVDQQDLESGQTVATFDSKSVGSDSLDGYDITVRERQGAKATSPAAPSHGDAYGTSDALKSA
jgi:hypothetical protein